MIRVVLLVTLLLFPTVLCKQCTLLVVTEINRNNTGPPYDFQTAVKDVKEDAYLIDVMNSAENQGFTYDGTWDSQLGFYIHTIIGLYADGAKKEFWEIMIGLSVESISRSYPLNCSSFCHICLEPRHDL
eukprot:sb/3475265/